MMNRTCPRCKEIYGDDYQNGWWYWHDPIRDEVCHSCWETLCDEAWWEYGCLLEELQESRGE